MPDRFEAITALLRDAVAARAFCAAIEIGRASSSLWRHATGTLTYDPEAAPAAKDTVFDLHR
jgi:hypothetical protein